MTFLRNSFTYTMVFFLLTSPAGVFANSSAWYLFSQGAAESSTDTENASHIQVLSEKLSIQVDEKGQSFLPPKNPSFWSYFLKQGKTAQQIQADTVSGKIWPTLLGYTSNHYSTDTQITATYVMSNTSEKAISIETGFSFFNKMEYNHGSHDIPCPDYVSVDDALLPQDFQIRSGNKVIPSSVELVSRPGNIECVKGTGLYAKLSNNPIQWILPVGHYTLNFLPKETKTVTVSYRTHLFGYGADYSYGRSAIFYDFEPIFSWGKGKIGKVDIVLTYPTKYEARFTKGTSFVNARERYDGDNRVARLESVATVYGTKIETIVPTSTKLLTKNLLQNTYSYKNVTIGSGMKALHFGFKDYLFNLIGGGFEIPDETF